MNVLTYTLCYPPGECHPDALLEMPPEGVELSGNYEIYEFETAHHIPEIGDTKDFPESGGFWTIAAVEIYSPNSSSDLKGVYHFICTRDGKPRKRERGSDYTVLGLKMNGQQIVWREPGFADWWYGSALSIPKPSATREVLTFTPKNDKPNYDIVVICRPVRMLQAA